MDINDIFNFSKKPLTYVALTSSAIAIAAALSCKQYYNLIKEAGLKGTYHVAKHKARETILEYLQVESGVKCVRGTNKYVVSYESKGKKYNILLEKKCRRPINNVVLVTHLNKDVTKEFRDWLGPYYDFHGSTVTPMELGYSELCIVTKDSPNNVLTFGPTDPIEF